MRRILITGAAGFLGSHLARKLLEDQDSLVIGIDNLFTGSEYNIEDLKRDSRFKFIYHDVNQPFYGQFDEIYNLACPASPIHYQHNPIETMKTSVLGIMNMLDLALKNKAKLFHASTSEIYGDPLQHPQEEHYWGNVNTIGVRSCYDEGKRAAETLCSDYRNTYGLDVRMVRIFNTYGPNMHPQDGRVISNFIMQALSSEDITIYGDGLQTRSFQYCSDLVDAIVKLMSVGKERIDRLTEQSNLRVPVFNAGNPNEYTIKQLAEKILEKIQSRGSVIVYKPLPGDDPKIRKPDISLIQKVIDWKPLVQLDEGLDKTIGYFRERYFR